MMKYVSEEYIEESLLEDFGGIVFVVVSYILFMFTILIIGKIGVARGNSLFKELKDDLIKIVKPKLKSLTSKLIPIGRSLYKIISKNKDLIIYYEYINKIVGNKKKVHRSGKLKDLIDIKIYDKSILGFMKNRLWRGGWFGTKRSLFKRGKFASNFRIDFFNDGNNSPYFVDSLNSKDDLDYNYMSNVFSDINIDFDSNRGQQLIESLIKINPIVVSANKKISNYFKYFVEEVTNEMKILIEEK